MADGILEIEARLKDFISQQLAVVKKDVTNFSASSQQAFKQVGSTGDTVSKQLEKAWTQGISKIIKGFLGFNLVMRAVREVSSAVDDYNKALETLGGQDAIDKQTESMLKAAHAANNFKAIIGTMFAGTAASVIKTKFFDMLTSGLEGFIMLSAKAQIGFMSLVSGISGHGFFSQLKKEFLLQEVERGFNTGSWKNEIVGAMDTAANEIAKKKKEIQDKLQADILKRAEQGIKDEEANLKIRGEINDRYDAMARKKVQDKIDADRAAEIAWQKEEEEFRIAQIEKNAGTRSELRRGEKKGLDLLLYDNRRYWREKATGVEAGSKLSIGIAKAQAAAEKTIMMESGKEQLATAVGNMRTIATQWKEFAGAYKAIAYAMAIWDTFSSATAIFNNISHNLLLGPAALPLAIAGAATAVGAGMANVSAISAQSFQTRPGEWKQVPGPANQGVDAIVHGGEMIGRPDNSTTSNSIVASPTIIIQGNAGAGTVKDVRSELERFTRNLELVFREKRNQNSRYSGLQTK